MAERETEKRETGTERDRDRQRERETDRQFPVLKQQQYKSFSISALVGEDKTQLSSQPNTAGQTDRFLIMY